MYGVEDAPIEQKGKLYAFYLKWNECKEVKEELLIEIVSSVNKEFREYKEGTNKKYKVVELDKGLYGLDILGGRKT